MTKRVPRPEFRAYTVTIEMPPSVDEETTRGIIDDLVKSLGTTLSSPPIVKVKTPRLRNRHVRKDRTFPCTKTLALGGTVTVGCGRTFTSEKNRDRHMDPAGIWSDTRRWPNGCLDAIVTPDLRDDR